MLKWELEEKYEALVRQHEEFRQRVRDKAIETAAEQSWCDSGLNAALEELGLELPTTDVSARVVVTFRVTGIAKAGWSGVTEDFIRESLVNLHRVQMDEDWEDVDMRVDSIAVRDIEAG